MTQSRPLGVTLIALLAGLQAVLAGYHTLQYLHILPFGLGPLSFFGFDLFGAVLWGATTLAYLWVARMLWNLEESGWIFAVMLAIWVLVFDLLSILGGTSLQAEMTSILVSAAILFYCLWPGTRQHFADSRGDVMPNPGESLTS